MRLALLFLLSMVYTVPALAQQGGELLWWVTNQTYPKLTEEQELLGETVTIPPTPPYVAGADENPFPVVKKPEPIQQQFFEEPVEVAQVDLKLEEANRVLERIRSYIAQNRVVQPNIQEVDISGYLKGVTGPQVLMNGTWQGVGANITVTSSQHQEFANLVAQLRGLSPVLLEELSRDFKTLEGGSSVILLTIKSITPSVVTLQDKDNKIYKINH